ncbi:multifunctional CCA addition/repair protein [Motilimonas cestriensis]|uniref:Multifunctional CCA protein n=1 Tax=Motilimonas cestriensis TaxID=2742685 RepID=A0ABS8WAB5_9GAMM|nr:multifunctional CCA addition/repair protein [Motilimonas cestriensis]
MQIYLVGGAVRDSLLKLNIKDRDYVVVGATPEQMIASGYQQVGKDFPVFLHPKTKQEYALARTERKTGSGYTGFACYFAQDVTLEQDLLRRDLTINAMAQDENGQIHDPYNGQRDLNNKVLRHISPAFAEDPLRVLRVARFAARYHKLGFTIAPETLTLMTQLSRNGELEHLTPERVWQEMSGALLSDSPQVFFQVLKDCQALPTLLPELNNLFGVPGPKRWHPEIDTGVHTLMVIEQAALLSQDLEVRFSALCHDFGKALTDPDLWPSHKHHGIKGLAVIKAMCQRCKVPNECRDLALIMSQVHGTVHRAFDLTAEQILELLDQADAWRKPQRFEQLLLTCKADLTGRLGFEDKPYAEADYLFEAYQTAQQVDVKPIMAAGFKGLEIKQQLSKERIQALNSFITQSKQNER